MHKKLFAAFGLIALISACASTPTPPPNAAPPLSAMERAGIPGIPHSEVIELAGEPTIATTPVARDGAILSFPFRYRHTAVLTEDVRGYSITVSGVQAPAGSPGYYAGTFHQVAGPSMGGLAADLWCFFPSAAGGSRDNICLLRMSPSLAAIAPTRLNPYLWTEFSPATGTFDYVYAPVFERREVEMPVDLMLEYRFEGWRGNIARVSERAVGRETREIVAQLNADNVATIRTIAGVLELSAASDDPEAVVANFTPLQR